MNRLRKMFSRAPKAPKGQSQQALNGAPSEPDRLSRDDIMRGAHAMFDKEDDELDILGMNGKQRERLLSEIVQRKGPRYFSVVMPPVRNGLSSREAQSVTEDAENMLLNA